MTEEPDQAIADGGGDAAAGERRTPRQMNDARSNRLSVLLRPVHYARNKDRYRPPPRLYSQLSRRLGPAATSLGLAPADVITLEVPGRRSGLIRRTTMVLVRCDGDQYLVSLAGESDWVRNVRAAAGHVVVGRRHPWAARLREVAADQRAPIIRAYLLRWSRRPGSRPVAREARYYFGVGPSASLDEIQSVAEHYPVFRIEHQGAAESRPGQGALQDCPSGRSRSDAVRRRCTRHR